ncbi:transcription factor Adf-1-like [Musca autumnalis]|uniref:transcription factor Adf-1-like n=1 Tax=Musca autumnalis TaxID=221902 RepID=UPI003CE905BB
MNERFEEKLINSIQQFECKYIKASPNYRNRIVKEKAWNHIAESSGKTVKQFQGRWKSLRERYVKENLKMASGSAAPEYTHQWTFFNTMSFLRDYVEAKPTSSNYNHYEGEDYEYLDDYLDTTIEDLSQTTDEDLSQTTVEGILSPEKTYSLA